MPHNTLKLALLTGLFVVTTPAQAAIYVFSANLRGSEEVPPANTTGSGFAQVTLDDTAQTLRVVTSFANLIGLTTASHIHCCQPFGVNASVATTTPSFVGFPLGVSSGSMDQTYDMTLTSSYRAGFITDNGGTVGSAFSVLRTGLLASQAYLNIHTSAFPGGEIRGQLTLLPEPSTWAMMLIGFGAIGGAMRRRRKATVVQVSHKFA